MPVDFVFAYAHSITDREECEEHEMCFFFSYYGNVEDLLMTVRAPTIDESQ